MSIFSSNKLPKGFLIALLLIFAFEFINIYFDNYFYSPQEQEMLSGLRRKIKNDISQCKENKFDILILGDCHSETGLIPLIIEEKTGLSCFNFSLTSFQNIIAYYFLFERYLKTHPVKPKYIIISLTPFHTYIETKSHYSEEALSRLADLKKGNVMAFAKEFGIVQGVKFIFPSIKHQGRLKDFLKNPFSFNMPTKSQISSAIKQVYEDKGHNPEWEVIERPPIKEEDKIGEYEMFLNKFNQRFNQNGFTISPFSLKYLTAMLELAKKNNITPIYYNPALTPYVFNRLKEHPYIKQHYDFINSLKQDYIDLILIEAQHILYKDDMFMDIYYTNENGAELLSNFMAQKINEIEENKQYSYKDG